MRARTIGLVLGVAMVTAPPGAGAAGAREPIPVCDALCSALEQVGARLTGRLPQIGSFGPGSTLTEALHAVVPDTPAVTAPPPASSVRSAIWLLLGAARSAERVRSGAVRLSPSEAIRATRLMSAPYETSDPAAPRRVRDGVAELAGKVDLAGLRRSAAIILAAIDSARPGLRAARSGSACEGAPTPPVELAEGQIAVDTTGVPTLYTKPYALSIDLGGCDVYRSTAGGSSAAGGRPVGIAIDLGADADLYEQPKESYGLGGSSGGLGVLVDAGGDDTYRASGYASMGAGVVGGVGLLVDAGGNDSYEYVGAGGGFGTQGYGTLGLGALIDLEGDDTYLFEFDPGDTSFGSRLLGAQGAGLVGAVGVLADASGDDDYRATTFGNTVSVEAQGAGNFLPSSGILVDGGGDDAYAIEAHVSKDGGHASGGAEGQGVGILDGVGLLMENGGNDDYRIVTDALGSTSASGGAAGQGFATAVLQYSGVGALVDRDGDDRYEIDAAASANDPTKTTATALGQGQGFFLATGLLADLGGSDSYRQTADAPGGDALSSGQGAGLGAAAGVLLDRSGADRYVAGGLAQGFGSTWRFFEDIWLPGGTGLLVDGAGRNGFTGPGRNGATWTQGVDGVGLGLDAGRAGLTGFDLVDGALLLFGMERPHAVIGASIAAPATGTILHGDLQVSGTADGGGAPVEWVEWRVDDSPWTLAEKAGDSWTAWRSDLDVENLADGEHVLRARAWGAGGAADSAAALANVTVERWLPEWDVRRQGDEMLLAFDLATRAGKTVDDGDVVLRVLAAGSGEVAATFREIGHGAGRYEAEWQPAAPGSYILRAEVEGQLLGQISIAA